MRQLNFTASLLIAALFLSFSSFLSLAEESPAEPYDPAIYRMGEDGQIYARRPWDDKTGWLMGKIHPDLVNLQPGSGELRVLIQLTHQPLSKAAKQEKQKRQKELDVLQTELKSLMDGTIITDSYADRGQEIEAALNVPISQDQLEVMKAIEEEMDLIRDEIADHVVQNVNNAVASDQQLVIDLCNELGGVISGISALSNNIGIRFESWDESTLITLAECDYVESISPDTPATLDLDQSACMLAADDFWDLGSFTGAPYDFGLLDSEIRDDHLYLLCKDPPACSDTRPIYKRYNTGSASHGTQTAGIVCSTHSTYTGIAYGTDAIINADGHNNLTESEAFENQDWVIDIAQHGNQGPEVINNSYSFYWKTDEFGDYERYMDSIVDDLNIAVTKSAGNCGPGSTCDPVQLGYPQSHNLISVSNLDINNTCATIDDDVIRSTSGRGPTDSGRRKPDITAPGHNTWSTDNASTTDFSNHTGTSASAPHVAGGCLLLRSAGVSSAMAQKAILINTADTWSDNDTLENYADDGPIDGDRWDDSYGWGVMDLGHAYTHRGDYFTDSVIENNDTSTDDDYKLYKGHMYANDKITLVWHRRAVFNDDQAPTTYYTLTDLNLRLYNESSGGELDNDLDGNDNVHQVSTNGSYNVVAKAYAWDYTVSGQSFEPYVLATEEGFQTAAPPTFYRNYSRPNYVGPYQTFDIIVRIFNNGDVTAHNNTLTLTDITKITVDGDNSQTLASILPGPYPDNPQEAAYSITTSGASAGTHWLPLDFESSCYLETYTYSTSSGVSIVVETDPPVATCVTPQYANSSPIAVDWQSYDAGCGVQLTYLYVKGPGQTEYSYSGLYDSGTSGVFNYTPTRGDGTYYFAARAVDNGLNWEDIPTSAEDTTLYDTVAPYSVCSSPAVVTSGDIPISYSSLDYSPASGINTIYFYYKKGLGDSWHHLTGMNQTTPSGIIYYTPAAGDGTYYFSCKAKDNAGNYQYGSGYPTVINTRTLYGSPCPGDCTGDGSTNIDDLLALSENWLSSGCSGPTYCNGCDLNGSGSVKMDDFDEVSANWLCTP